MTRSAVVFLAVLVVARAALESSPPMTTEEEWQTFKLQHHKQYKSEVEEKVRREIFLHNRHLVMRHNQRHAQNLTSFTLSLNHFADKLTHEITSLLTAPPKPQDLNITASKFLTPEGFWPWPLPSTVDWRKKGAVTGVKTQLQCASGWAFATTGTVEGQVFRRWSHLISMSEQNLIDCCHLCYGCRGGRMDYALTYIMQNGGLDSEVSYPYEAKDSVCRYRPQASVARVVGYSSIPPGDENALKTAVAKVGPIAVAIDASLPTFHYYSHGVYYDPHCSSTQLTHGALVVGYGREGGHDYWLVKNSWGTNWGQGGYIKMARNLNNNCGIATAAVYPHV